MTRKKIVCMSAGLILGLVLFAAASAMKSMRTQDEWDGGPYKLEEVNALDARFARPYDKALDDLGTGMVLAANAIACCAVAMISFCKTKEKKKAFGTLLLDAMTYLACGLYSCGVYKILKNLAGRLRPYMYFPNPSIKGVAEGDFCRSWPSGHSSFAFMAFAFMVCWFAARYPRSGLRKPALCFFLLAGLCTMALRMLSGNHFLTDVLSGAALGFLVSALVFRVSNAILGRNQS
ncbi:MAG: phosphatase PAP2 family protein [Treponema sp.]|nr:phosphatase PAP2 family protein [Treponema sp.]